MALFPAYADTKAVEADLEESAAVSVGDGAEPSDVDEVEILKSDVSADSLDSPEPTSPISKKKKKRKRSRERERNFRNHEEGKEAPPQAPEAEYYEDVKMDYMNLRASSLYYPAIPHFNHHPRVLGLKVPKSNQRKRESSVRYFRWKPSEEDLRGPSLTGARDRRRKQPGEYIPLQEAAGALWMDCAPDTHLTEKTTNFNKYLNRNPYDVDMWLQFVKFQEELMWFNVNSHRVSSVSGARSLCQEKQLAILDTALKTNYNSLSLLRCKVQLAEQHLPHEQFLSMLKTLITSPELRKSLLPQAWFWYIEAVQTSMALCSVSSVKEMFSAAIRALQPALGQEYQHTHNHVVYRLGLFLRQAGLWEQLWQLLSMSLDMNLPCVTSSTQRNFILPDSAAHDAALLPEENKIVNSGLPLHSIWSRVERLRSRLHWLPSRNADDADDPQRVVFSTDLIDFIHPVINKQCFFVMIVNTIRLLKVPLLPQRPRVDLASPAWQMDSGESLLPLLYCGLTCLRPCPPHRLEALTHLIKDFCDEPNYLDMTGDYWRFVSSVMVQCSEWLQGPQRTALLVWWLRLQRTLISASGSSVDKSVSSLVRKSVKDVLKCCRDDTVLYAEFGLLEVQLCGAQRGLFVLETTLRTALAGRTLARTYLTRIIVDLLVRDSLRGEDTEDKCLCLLVSLVEEQPLPVSGQLPRPSQHQISQAIQASEEHLDVLLSSPEESCFGLLPQLSCEWLRCHGHLLRLARGSGSLGALYQRLSRTLEVTQQDKEDTDTESRLYLFEGLCEWYMDMLELPLHHADAPHEEEVDATVCEVAQLLLQSCAGNVCAVWRLGGLGGAGRAPLPRWRSLSCLKESSQPDPLLALGLVLSDYILIYLKENPLYADVWQEGHEHRLLSVLRALCAVPALGRCPLLWLLLQRLLGCEAVAREVLYRALDACPWHKPLYERACYHTPAEFAELVDLMVEKQLRLHAMPEELHPL